jgi:nucleoside-diphosphate-sugar epimerase
MKISVLGCGWLGFPLAQQLVSEGYSVKGSTTSSKKLKSLKQAGIIPFQLTLPDQIDNTVNDDFWNADTLFLNIPPGRGSNRVVHDYPELIQSVVEKVKTTGHIKWILFASSTSVYSENGGLTAEEDATPGNASRPSGEAVLTAEEIIRESGIDYTIIRFGGLYGYGRHPVNYLAGKKDLHAASKPVNLIHRTDCIEIISLLIRKGKRNKVYNAVSDGHPPRETFYRSAARHFNLAEPQFNSVDHKEYRVISNEKLKRELEYSFSYPNPMDHTP